MPRLPLRLTFFKAAYALRRMSAPRREPISGESSRRRSPVVFGGTLQVCE